MADEKPTGDRPDSTAVDADTDGGSKCSSSLATQSPIPKQDGIPNVNQQVSTAEGFSDPAPHGAETCDLIGNTTTAGSSNSPVAEGLYSLISSVMTGFDSRADATARSQDQLAFSLDRLTGELDKLLEDAPSPFIMQHAMRISGLRKRVKALNITLKSTQRRIDNMDRMLSAGSVPETLVGETTGQQPAL